MTPSDPAAGEEAPPEPAAGEAAPPEAETPGPDAGEVTPAEPDVGETATSEPADAPETAPGEETPSDPAADEDTPDAEAPAQNAEMDEGPAEEPDTAPEDGDDLFTTEPVPVDAGPLRNDGTYKLVIPQVEHATVTVTRGEAALADGDPIAVGDVLTITTAPDTGYALVDPSAATRTVTLTAQDLVAIWGEPVALTFTPGAGEWSEVSISNDYAGYFNGWKVRLPRGDNVEKTITAPAPQSGTARIRFSWATNRDHPDWGKFYLNFYVNDGQRLRDEKYQTNNVLPVDVLVEEDYFDLGSVEAGATLKWGYQRTSSNWADAPGRVGYLGTVELQYLLANGYCPEAAAIQCAHAAQDAENFCANCGEFLGAPVDGYYQLATPRQLAWFAAQVNSGNTAINGRLTADVDYSAYDCLNMIGLFNTVPFTGDFDGQHHTVTWNCTFPAENGGLFRYVSGATIQNLNMAGTYTVESTSGHIGGIVGHVRGTAEDATVIRNCVSSVAIVSSVEGDATSGGIVAHKQDDTILLVENCAFVGSITGSKTSHSAGILGYANGGSSKVTIRSCYVDATFDIKDEESSVISRGEPTIEDCCYVTPFGNLQGTEIPVEGVASGLLAYTLMGSYWHCGQAAPNPGWYQTLGDGGDPRPVLDSTHGTVYAGLAADTSCIGDYTLSFSNDPTALPGSIVHRPDALGYGHDQTHHWQVCADCGWVWTERTVHVQDQTGTCVCGFWEPMQDEDGFYLLDSAAALAWFRDRVNQEDNAIKGRLTADIDLNPDCFEADGCTVKAGAFPTEWTPIGDSLNGLTFRGELDGAGHVISGLYINSPKRSYQALVGELNGDGQIRRLTVRGSVTGSSNSAGICGNVASGSIRECRNEASVHGNNYVGGVCGDNDVTIQNVSNTGNISGNDNVGGVCGSSFGTIQDAFNTGSVSGNNYVGGVCGSSNGTIQNAFNTGDVSCGNNYVGGVCGRNYGTIQNAFNTGSITGSTYVNAVCGKNFSYSAVQNAYYLDTCGVADDKGTPLTATQFASGEAAWLMNGGEAQADPPVWYQDLGPGGDDQPVLNSSHGTVYAGLAADISCTVAPTLSFSNDPTAVSGKIVHQPGALAYDHDQTHHWQVCTDCDQVVTERIEHVLDQTGVCVCGYWEATRDEEGFYLLPTAEALSWFRDRVNQGDSAIKGRLTADIDLNPGCFEADGCTVKEGASPTAWTPIGDRNSGSGLSFRGELDGAGHVIAGLYINTSDPYQGLVGYLNNGGQIRRLTVRGSVTGGSNSAGICGCVSSASISECRNEASVHGSTYVGGVCGYNNGGMVQNAFNTGDVSCTGNDVGGVCGRNYGTIQDAFNSGVISGNSAVGGVCGRNYNEATIQNVSNTGDISGDGYVGGVCGRNHNEATIQNVSNTGSVSANDDCVGGVCGFNYSEGTIQNAFNAGDISGEKDYVGGVCGWNNGGTIQNAFNTGNISGNGDNVGGVCGINNVGTGTIPNVYYLDTCGAAGTGTALTAAQFASGEAAWLLNGGEDGKTDGRQHWYQTLGNGGDPLPVLDSSHRTVYAGLAADTSCTEDYTLSFSNDPTAVPGRIVHRPAALGYGHDRSHHWQICADCGREWAERIEHTLDSDLTCLCGYREAAQDEEGFYLLDTAEALAWFRDCVNWGDRTIKGRLTTDIDLSPLCHPADAANGIAEQSWVPIGDANSGNAFRSELDGAGHVISGLYINTSKDYQALVGQLLGDGQIRGLTVRGSVTGQYRTAGICSYVGLGSISECRNEATVHGDNYVGGVCSVNTTNSTLQSVSNTGDISGNDHVGGVFGANDGIVQNVSNTGSVSCSKSYVGGVGASNSGTIQNTFNTGDVSCENDYVGGVCGYNYGKGTIQNAYYLNTCGAAGNGTALTAARFASGEAAWLLNGGDDQADPSVWFQDLGPGGDDHPVLDSSHRVVFKMGDGYTNTPASLSGTLLTIHLRGIPQNCKQMRVITATYNGTRLSDLQVHPALAPSDFAAVSVRVPAAEWKVYLLDADLLAPLNAPIASAAAPAPAESASGLPAPGLFQPDADGKYSITCAGTTAGCEYALLVAKGVFASAQDPDILRSLVYIEQRTATGSSLTFADIAPLQAQNATVFLAGGDLSAPVLAGYLVQDVATFGLAVSFSGQPLERTIMQGSTWAELLATLPDEGTATLSAPGGCAVTVPVSYTWSEAGFDSATAGRIVSVSASVAAKNSADSWLRPALSQAKLVARVFVQAKDPVPQRLAVEKTQVVYTAGDTLSDADVTVTVLYDDGTTAPADGWASNIAALSAAEAGTQTLQITWNGLEAALELTIQAPEEIYYTVSFDAQGGTPVTTVPVKEGATLALPEPPSRVGYQFAGWYTDADCTAAFDEDTQISGDLTLYASWWAPAPETQKFAVTLNANGGKVAGAPSVVLYVAAGESYGDATLTGNALPDNKLPTPARTGYTFEGWYTQEEGGDAVTAETAVELTGDTTLYARWEVLRYTVTLDAGDGRMGNRQIRRETVTYGEDYGDKLVLPTRAGHTFEGWYTAEEGGEAVTAETAVELTGDITLYAHWSVNQYTLTLDAGAGTVDGEATKTITVTYGEPYTGLVDATRSGYAFAGWYTATAGGEKITAENTVALTSDVTLYARWAADQYTVTLNAAGGTVDGEATKTLTVAYGETFAGLVEPVRTGYKFKGWYTQEEDGDEITAETEVELTGDITLYAHWAVEKYTVTLDAGDGRMGNRQIKPVTVTYGEAYGEALVLPTRIGFIFLGWYTLPQGEEDARRITTEDAVAIAENHTLYAHWSDATVTMTANLADSEPLIYDGKAKEPDLKVYGENGEELTDYTVKFSNNTAANWVTEWNEDGTPKQWANKKTPTAKITGKGDYSGSITVYFEIKPRTLTNAEGKPEEGVDLLVVPVSIAQGKNGKPQYGVPTVKLDGKALKNKTDFVLEYPATEGDWSSPGEYQITIKFKGNYAGECTTTETIFVTKETTALSKVKMDPIENKVCTGKPIVLTGDDLVLKNGDYTLKQGTDYDIIGYENNVKPGTAKVTLAGKGNYSGIVTKTFKITATALKAANVQLELEMSNNKVVYCPAAPNSVVKNIVVTCNGEPLTENADYTVEEFVVKNGTNKVTVRGINAYSGVVTKSFKVTPFVYTVTDDVPNIDVVAPESVPYAKGGAKFDSDDIKVTAGTVELKPGTDYTVSYANNTAVNGKKAPTVKITFKGNYSGNWTDTFQITAQDIANVDVKANDIAYTGKPGKYTTTVTLTDANANGKAQALKLNTDYTLKYYRGEVTLDQIDAEDLQPLDAKSPALENGEKVTVVATGVGNYTGSTLKTFTVKPKDKLVSGAKISLASGVKKYYTGEEVFLSPDELVVKVGKETLVYGEHYTVTYTNNTNVGTATVTIRGIGEYGGEKTFTFKINARKMSITETLLRFLSGG